jgi:arylsulfatase A-like enzyme
MVRDGALLGRSTTTQPVVELSAPAPLGGGDRLHSLEVRMKVSGGTLLRVNSFGEGGLPTALFGGPDAPRGLESPLLPGESMQTYSFVMATSFAPGPFERARVQRLVLRPTDAVGATFAIESVRLFYRREHLAAVPSGVGWRGLGEVYRESLVTRPGEVVRRSLRLPPRPLLDLAVGTLAELPVAFRVDLREVGGDEARTVLRRTVTNADRWELDAIPLDEWAGEEVELVMRAECDSADALALWGSPVVRSRLAGSAMPEAERPQGVILVIADTLRRDHLDAWGYGRPTAPTLRRLAGEGVQFRDAVSQGVWTKVSVPSILSSLYPSTHGIVDFADRLPAAVTTLAEAYRAAGFATFATSAVPFSGQLSNLHQGTEVLHEVGSFVPPNEEQRSKQSRDFVGRAIAFIEGHREVPFLVVLHVFDPHAPYRPLEPYDGLWASPADADWFRGEEEKVRKLIPATSPRRRVAAPTREEMERAGIDGERFVKHEIGWYDGSIRGMDAEIGRLMDRLDHLGLADRVVLAFLADHGEEFLEHGSHWHGQNVYGENANVPLALWGPRYLPEGVKVEPTVQLVDVMPTLLELSGLPVPERAQGKSLLPLVRAADGKPAAGWRQRPAFTERAARALDAGVKPGFAMVKERWKLVQHEPAPPGQAVFELFDHRADPLDRHDLAATRPDVVRALAGELARWRKWAAAQRLPAESAGAIDAAELARLKSLGYLN